MRDDAKAGVNPARTAAGLSEQMDAATQTADMVDIGENEPPFDRYVNAIAEILGVAVLVVFATVVFVNAVGRYAGNFALVWGDEVVISLMPWLGMCGMFLSIRRRQIIRIDYFTDKLPPRTRTAATFFANVLSAAMFVYLAIVSLDFVQLFGGDRTIYLQIPTGLFTSSLVIGSLGAALAYGIETVRDLRRAKEAAAAAELPSK
jgi:TRAP-type C4-dicarboxylate transport system permease small subunit